MKTPKPFSIELEASPDKIQHPSDAPVISDPHHQMNTHVTQLHNTSTLLTLFISAITAVIGFMVSVSLWDFSVQMFSRHSTLGFGFSVILAMLAFIAIIFLFRELIALKRLGRIDKIRQRSIQAIQENDLDLARATKQDILKLYNNRSELHMYFEKIHRNNDQSIDPSSMLANIDMEIFTPLDRAAEYEIEKAARQVATFTALVPLAFADVIAAMLVNIRMIKNIAKIYGGHSGTIGSWRLLRTVTAHLITTGAMAIGDDWLGSILGGSVFSKISRRFGEGMINGALTARVGCAAIDVCRPLPYIARSAPSLRKIISRAFTGLFQKDDT